jgi:hypothetical protein
MIDVLANREAMVATISSLLKAVKMASEERKTIEYFSTNQLNS